MSRYFTSEKKEDIWLALQIFGGLTLFIGLLVGIGLVITSISEGGKKINEKIEVMSCDELREFLLTHGNLQTGFSKAERQFKYRPCE